MLLFVIVIPLLLLAVALMLYSSLRRREADRATGHLSGETMHRDRASRRATPLEEGTTGRDVERAAQLARRGGDLVPVSESAPPAPFVPPDPEAIGVSRRQFLNRSIMGGMVLGLSGFGASVLAFLWPQVKGGFGSKISVGKITDIQAEVTKGSGFAYYPEGRMWITKYPADALDKAKKVYSAPELAAMEAGVVALYQKCVHLGCRVPQSLTSQGFESPCQGSQYNRVGDKKG